jgi:spermidine/putrescine transport system substrate-binding protein
VKSLATALIAFALLTLIGCGSPSNMEAKAPQLAGELVLYNWAEDLPQSVLDQFTSEYGVSVIYLTFTSQEEALEKIRRGMNCDVAIIENQYIPALVGEGLLHPIELRNVPNIRNISPDFRDLQIDPGNRYTIPYHFGTTGLLVRTDLVGQAIDQWTDLWDPRLAGRVGVRPMMRDLMGIVLLSLGHPVNSEDPAALLDAEKRLLELRKSLVFVEVEASRAVSRLLEGELWILAGWSEDYIVSHSKNPHVQYILPGEGTVLWGDNYVIPAGSRSKHTAEAFLNFLLRPEISARIVNEKKCANANEAAKAFIDPVNLNNPVIYPPLELLRKSGILSPLSPQGERTYVEIWMKFPAGG